MSYNESAMYHSNGCNSQAACQRHQTEFAEVENAALADGRVLQIQTPR
jgi:hypothetical protein